MKKKLLTLFISLLTFSLCVIAQNHLISQTDSFLQEKSSILNSYSESLTQFNKITYLLDSDIESQWSYRQADSLLSIIDMSGKSYFEDLTKVHAAYTYIFYGLSYTNAINTIGKRADYTLEELVETIIRPLSGSAINYNNIAEHELASIYSMINFYKVGRMFNYDLMQTIFDEYAVDGKEIHQKYRPEEAYRITSLEYKKLHYKIMSLFIVDVYYINHPDDNDASRNEYIGNIVRLGEIMDEIPIAHESILALSDAEYYGSILKASEVHNKMFDLLVEQLNIRLEII